MIPLFRPDYDTSELVAISGVLNSHWTGLGAVVDRFEKEFAAYIGTRYAVAVSSGTAALDLSVRCLVEPGAHVITTPLSFVSTASCIVKNGCIPIFTDIDKNTLNLDPHSIPKEHLELASAIIPVHYSGRPCDMTETLRIARAYNLKIIEDAAHACGASYMGRKCGSYGDTGCFSFHAVKNLSCGDGGMITTDDKALAERLRRLRWCGIGKNTWERERWEYEIEERGEKAHMNDITAAIGIEQLKKLDDNNAKRKRLAERYTAEFNPGHHAIMPDVITPISDTSSYQSSWHLYPIQVENRDELYEHLKQNGITAGVHYKPIYNFKAYREYKVSCPNADTSAKQLLSLPMYVGMTDDEQDTVINHIKRKGLRCQR